MAGRVDLFHSRRTYYCLCEYWIRDERTASGTPQQWVLYNQPAGTFHARPVSAKSSQINVINGVWAKDSDHVTLETDDEVHDIERGCVVKYAEALWIVESVQRELHLKESEFCVHQDYRYVIALVRG